MPNTAQLKDAIDTGKTGDKVAFPDPAAAPLGTDDEAGGNSPTPEQIRMAAEQESGPRHGIGPGGTDERGQPVVDDSFLLCFNAHYEDIEFTVPADEYAREWAVVVDTTDGTVVVGSTTRPDGDPADGYGAEPIELADAHTVMANDTITVTSRSLLVLQRLP